MNRAVNRGKSATSTNEAFMHKSPQTTRTLRSLLAFFLLLGMAFPQPAPAEENADLLKIKPQIAVILPLSGPFADLGQNLKLGFERGFAQDRELKPEARQFTTDFFDSEGNPETARALIEMLHSSGETLIAAGTPLHTTAWTASQACEKSGLPYLIVGADQDNLINEKNVFSFRLTPTRAAKETMLAQFIDAQIPPIQSLAIIYDESSCSIHQARRLRKLCASKNIDLALWEVYRDNDSNFYDLLNLIKERQPQMLFLATSSAHGDKLWQQGERLQLLPAITIAMSGTSLPGSNNPAAANPPVAPEPQLLHLTTWHLPTEQLTTGHLSTGLPAADQEKLPLPENDIQAQGFAAAELILAALNETLNRSLGLTSTEIIKTLESHPVTTVYGQVIFSGPGRGHQNSQPWFLCRTDETGTDQIVFPRAPDSGEATPEGEKKRSPAEAQ
ncbi:MAG: ABC transporter substrate-binding protein [Deltaproteobacteria bacterium]|nr:ABC transporter substrate-binding protein [Deltaproteobacteria bacterium]